MKKAFCILAFCAGAAQAQMAVDLSASASVAAPNDLVKVSVYVEENGENPAQLAKSINPKVNDIINLAKSKKSVRTKTGYQRSFPIYEKNRLKAWRMRAEVELESEDVAAMSELVGALQAKNVGVNHIQQMPSPETRKRVEMESTKKAIEEFQARAAEIASVFKKPYRIKSLNVNQERGGAVFRSNAMLLGAAMDEAAPAARIETGESQISTFVSGVIEIPNH